MLNGKDMIIIIGYEYNSFNSWIDKKDLIK